jgi:hypothetical protein
VSDDEARAVRAAENQNLFRTVNERVSDLNSAASFSEVTEWVCECADPACTERISMTVDEYEALRSDGNSFAVAHGHELIDVEDVGASTDRYLVVSKRSAGADKARRLDPRS